MSSSNADSRAPHAGTLVALRRHLHAAEEHLRQVRECVLHELEPGRFALTAARQGSQPAVLERMAAQLREERERLVERLQQSPGPAQARRFQEFHWTRSEHAEVVLATERVRCAAARLAGAVRAARGALGVWSNVIQELLGTSPRVGRYSPAGELIAPAGRNLHGL